MDEVLLEYEYGDWAGIKHYALSLYEAASISDSSKNIKYSSIYTNEYHQLVLNFAFELTDKNGKTLTGQNLPSANTVQSAISIIDYYTGKVPLLNDGTEGLIKAYTDNGYAIHYPSGVPADKVLCEVRLRVWPM